MPRLARPLAGWCAATVMVAGCSHTVAGRATPSPADVGQGSRSPVDVETVMLDKSRMRAITGGGEDLTIIPSMDVTAPVDIELLADQAPPQCGWFFKETQTFGPDLGEFHKTTFQDPPKGALISEGAAVYRDAGAARHAFDGLVGNVSNCDSTEFGPTFVGDWSAGSDSLRTRASGGCGRNYRLKSVVLIEVTFCAFPDSVPEIVIANMLAKVPG